MKPLIVFFSYLAINYSVAQQNTQGLRAEYFQGINFNKKVATRVDRQINFHWDKHNKPALGLELNYFSVRWTGRIYAPVAGTYYFSATADDGIRIWIDGINILDDWLGPGQANRQMPYELIGKRSSVNFLANHWYNIQVEYANGWDKSQIVLYWELPIDTQSPLGTQGIFRKVIPAQNLSPISKPIRLPVPTVAKTKLFKKISPLPKWREPINELRNSPSENVLSVVEPAPEIKLEQGQPVILHQVQFAQSSYVLMAESYPVLNQLVALLKQNPAQRIAISGHTDNIGDARLNLTLSEYRARQVANYLTQQGIATNRIETKGYGGERPIANNGVAIERAKNRRVEVLLL